ncbi:MAG: LptF/LptG family permease [Candidatus Zixiibacteriota bacterium]
MWILTRYILREHLGPFLFAFFVITFVLIIDFIPQMLELIIGKDLSTWTVLKFLVLNLAWMLALAVPMAVLVGTLMAFGRMTGDKEILAIKSLGIDLFRLMIPVVIAASLIGAGLIWFNNDVLPEANHMASNLRSDIGRLRPTFQLQPGVFVEDIPGYIVLVEDIDHTTSRIKNAVIYDRTNQNVNRTITADSGLVEFSPRDESITFHLMDGQVHEQDRGDNHGYRISAFKSQTFKVGNLDTRLKETQQDYRGDREMSAPQMLDKVHAWEKEIVDYRNSIVLDTDSSLFGILKAPVKPVEGGNRNELEWMNYAVGQSFNKVVQMTRLFKTRRTQINTNIKLISKYSVEIHKKYSLPAACLAFILIGAPLGVVSRGGGMALSVGISIGLFTIYWAFLIGGEQLADRLFIPPWLAMWAANILMVCIGFILIYWVRSEKSFVAAIRSIFWRRN